MEYTLNRTDDTVHVTINGDLTFSDHQAFRHVLTALAQTDPLQNLVVHVHNVSFIDSAGIGMLIIANDEAKERNQSLTVRGPREQVKAALDIADMQSLLRLEA